MAYISKEDSAQIRRALKETFPKHKFSVRIDHASSIYVTLLSGPDALEDTLTVRHDPYDQSRIGQRLKNTDVNQFHVTEENYGRDVEFHDKVLNIIKNGSDRKWFDESDSMTDYFHTAFYINYSVGKWDRPYVHNKEEK